MHGTYVRFHRYDVYATNSRNTTWSRFSRHFSCLLSSVSRFVPTWELASLVSRRSPSAHSTRLGAKCLDVTENWLQQREYFILWSFWDVVGYNYQPVFKPSRMFYLLFCVKQPVNCQRLHSWKSELMFGCRIYRGCVNSFAEKAVKLRSYVKTSQRNHINR